MSLYIKAGGEYRPASVEEITTVALYHSARKIQRGAELTDPRKAHEWLILTLGQLEHEIFSAIFLNNKHRVIAHERLFRGTLDGSSVHPREVVKAALHHNAAAVILAHNHPSGDIQPSACDAAITKRLTEALALVEVRVLDSIICSDTGATSMAEAGLL